MGSERSFDSRVEKSIVNVRVTHRREESLNRTRLHAKEPVVNDPFRPFGSTSPPIGYIHVRYHDPLIFERLYMLITTGVLSEVLKKDSYLHKPHSCKRQHQRGNTYSQSLRNQLQSPHQQNKGRMACCPSACC